MKITLLHPWFCWAQRFEANSAFNIPCIDVASLTPLLIWKLFDMWSQSAAGFLRWVSMENGIFFMNQRSVGMCGSLESTSSPGGRHVCGRHLSCGVLYCAYSISSRNDRSTMTAARQKDLCRFLSFTICVSYCVSVSYHRLITLMLWREVCVFVTVCCWVLQHSLSVVGWLL